MTSGTRLGMLAFCLVSAGLAQEVSQLGQPSRQSQGVAGEAAPNQYIVKFRSGTAKNTRAIAALAAGAIVRYNYDGADMIAVTTPNPSAVEALRRHGQVVDVTPDRLVRVSAKPGGGTSPPMVFNSRQMLSYEVQRVGAPATGSDGTGIGVAVLDTGIDFAHPDLKPAPNAAATRFNALTPGASCQDDGGHGTHVSGLIAAQNNTIGIVGVAPAATLYCVKVLYGDLTKATPESVVVAGLDWVLQNHDKVATPIRVVNMSLGRQLAAGETIDSTPMLPLIRALYNVGVVVVVSAGNVPTQEVTQMVPAGYAEVLAVAGAQGTNGINTCSTTLTYVPVDAAWRDTTDGAFVGGRGVTTSAPAEERTDLVALQPLSSCVGLAYGVISTTLNTGGATRKLVPSLWEARGTSFAAPLVSGVVARVMQKKLAPATFDPAEVEGIRTWIRNNADRKGEAPLDHPWGTLVNYTFDGEREGIAQAPK